jgi:hypothetical protein
MHVLASENIYVEIKFITYDFFEVWVGFSWLLTRQQLVTAFSWFKFRWYTVSWLHTYRAYKILDVLFPCEFLTILIACCIPLIIVLQECEVESAQSL